MGLEEQVLEYVRNRCKKEGLETKPRIYTMARELNVDKDELIEVVKKLESEGILEYITAVPSESHICPIVDPEEPLKERILSFISSEGKSDIYDISRKMGLDFDTASGIIFKLIQEKKAKIDVSEGYSAIELA